MTTTTGKPIRQWQREIHAWARGRGWYERERPLAELLLLVNTEVTEAYEEYRDGHDPTQVYYATDKNGQSKPEGVPTELADVAIRLFDLCEYFGIDLEAEIDRKMAFNETRPYRHGGKRA